jgi:hypothetical protein
MPGADCSSAIDQGERRVATSAALQCSLESKNYFAAPAGLGEVQLSFRGQERCAIKVGPRCSSFQRQPSFSILLNSIARLQKGTGSV